MHAQRNVSFGTDIRVGGRLAVGRIGALVHSTEGTNSLDWLQGGSARAGSPASCDALITREGERFWLTPSGRYAYHAGMSRLVIPARPGVASLVVEDQLVSQYLIGIELERVGDQVITDDQVDSLAELLARQALIHRWRWPLRVWGHYALARPVGRRSDPVNFDWGSFAGRLADWCDQLGVAGIKLQR